MKHKWIFVLIGLIVLVLLNQNCSEAPTTPQISGNNNGNTSSGAGSTTLSSLEGRTIAFVKKENRFGQNQHHIFLMDLDKNGKGVNVRPLTQPNSIEPEDQPLWSPDGSKIAYHNGAGMWFINADGSGTGKTLIGSSTSLCGTNPHWSPDGKKFVYARVITNNGCTDPGPGNPISELRIINADGTGDKLLLSSGGVYNVEPRWSIDNKIYFMSGRAFSQDAFVVNIDGTGLTQLTFSSGGVGIVGDPFVSPNGKFISFNSNREGPPLLNVFTMDLQSKVIKQLTFYKNQNGHAYEAGDTSWTSDGQWITFEYDIDGQGQSIDNVYADVRIVPADASLEPIATGQECAGVGCAPRFKP